MALPLPSEVNWDFHVWCTWEILQLFPSFSRPCRWGKESDPLVVIGSRQWFDSLVHSPHGLIFFHHRCTTPATPLRCSARYRSPWDGAGAEPQEVSLRVDGLWLVFVLKWLWNAMNVGMSHEYDDNDDHDDDDDYHYCNCYYIVDTSSTYHFHSCCHFC